MEMTGCGDSEPYALQVLGDSMEPEFPDKCIVVIDPVKTAGNGDYAIVEYDDVRWLRQFVVDEDGSKRLVALNDIYPEIELTETYSILGVVVQRNIKRKIKHYSPKFG